MTSLAFTACGDDTTSGGDNNVRNENNGTPVPMGSQLLHTGSCAGRPTCALDVTFNSEAPLRVQLVDGDGNPVNGARVEFALEANDAAGTTLDAASASTNSEGFAEVRIRAGSTIGVAQIVASTPSDTSVSPVSFSAAIAPKDSASYRINLTHRGPANLKDVTAYLYESTVTCDDVRTSRAAELDDDPMTTPTLTALESAMNIINVDGTLPVIIFPARMNGESYTVAVRAQSRDNAEVELAAGCADNNPAIENGNSVDVTVDLYDHLPRVKGDFAVTHTFAIQDAVCMQQPDGSFAGVLPSGVCTAIDLIGKLATDPASFLVGEAGSSGLLDLIVDFLPDDGLLGDLKGTIQTFLDNDLITGIAGDALNTFFDDWLTMNAPDWVVSSFDITADIFETLNSFRVAGIIRISEDPVPMFDSATGQVSGMLAEDATNGKPGTQIWEDVIVLWTGDCAPNAPDSCRERTFGAEQLGVMGSVVQGDFTGSVVALDDTENPGYGLVIDEHSLTLNYGTLALGIIEKVVFPSIFGPNVDSIDEAIDFLLISAVGGQDGCQGLADFVNDEVGGGNTVNTIVDNLCNNLLQSASDAVRTYLTENLVLDGEDAFTLSTTEPCRLVQPEAYTGDWVGSPLPYAAGLGTQMAECSWDVSIQAGSTTIDTTAPFNGTRSNF